MVLTLQKNHCGLDPADGTEIFNALSALEDFAIITLTLLEVDTLDGAHSRSDSVLVVFLRHGADEGIVERRLVVKNKACLTSKIGERGMLYTCS